MAGRAPFIRGGSRLTDEAMEGSERSVVGWWEAVEVDASAASGGFSRLENPTEGAGGGM